MRTLEGRAHLRTNPHFRSWRRRATEEVRQGLGQKCGEEPAHEDKVKRPSKGKEARVA